MNKAASVAYMSDQELTAAAAVQAGVVGRFDLSGRFAVVKGWEGRDWFAPLEDDADAFRLAILFPLVPFDKIVRSAHVSINQQSLLRRYVRRNVVLTVVELAFKPRQDRYDYGY